MSHKIYKQYCDGVYITNPDLEQAIIDYRTAEEALLKLGPCFEVSRKAVSMTLRGLEGFQKLRKDAQ